MTKHVPSTENVTATINSTSDTDSSVFPTMPHGRKPMPQDKIASESRMRETRLSGSMRGRGTDRFTLPTLLIQRMGSGDVSVGDADSISRIGQIIDP